MITIIIQDTGYPSLRTAWDGGWVKESFMYKLHVVISYHTSLGHLVFNHLIIHYMYQCLCDVLILLCERNIKC